MVAVIVINYRNEEQTIRFVREEVSRISAPHEVVVVDNASTAESAAALRKGLPEGCKVLEMKENAGFARGNNAGAAVFPEADFYLFANNDIVFTDPSVVDAMAARLSELPEYGVIGPKVVGLDGKLQSPHPYRSFWHRHVAIYWSNLYLSRKKHAALYETVVPRDEGPCYLVSGCFFMAFCFFLLAKCKLIFLDFCAGFVVAFNFCCNVAHKLFADFVYGCFVDFYFADSDSVYDFCTLEGFHETRNSPS